MNISGFEKKALCIRLSAVLLCLTLISTYLSSDIFARYYAKRTANDSVSTATLGTIALNDFQLTDITPGVDITRDFKITRTANTTDASAWIILAIKKGSWKWDYEENSETANPDRFYISNNFSNPHRLNTPAYPVYFDIETTPVTGDTAGTHTWRRIGTIAGADNYVFYAQLVDFNTSIPNTENRDNILKNNTVYVSAEINNEDVPYINGIANTLSFKPFYVSSYGFSDTDGTLKQLCKSLYDGYLTS